MVIHAAILIVVLLLTLAAAAGEPSAATTPQCLACHTAHYTDFGTCSACHRGDPRTTRKNIAHAGFIPARYAFFRFSASRQVRSGKRTIAEFGCRRCHTVFGRGRRAAADLDTLVQRSSAQQIHDAIKSPALQMPDFRFAERQLDELVNAIENAGSTAALKHRETPQVIHFSAQGKRVENAFEKRCGACHRLLTDGLGGIGSGQIGPNLSGLFSEFYPATYRDKQRWSPAGLQKWLQNPRKIRPVTAMRPVPLDTRKLQEITRILQGSP